MRLENYTFGLWWTAYDAGYETMLTALPLLFVLTQYSVSTFNSKLLLAAGAVGFHLYSCFCTQALYHVGLMFITLDILEKNKVDAGRYRYKIGKTDEHDEYIDWLDTIIGVGFACGLIHPLILYCALGFLHCYVAQQKQSLLHLGFPVALLLDVLAPGIAVHFVMHLFAAVGTIKREVKIADKS